MAAAAVEVAHRTLVDAGMTLFGRGDPWTDGVGSAVAHARQVGVT